MRGEERLNALSPYVFIEIYSLIVTKKLTFMDPNIQDGYF